MQCTHTDYLNIHQQMIRLEPGTLPLLCTYRQNLKIHFLESYQNEYRIVIQPYEDAPGIQWNHELNNTVMNLKADNNENKPEGVTSID